MPAPPPAVLRHEGVVGHEEEGARQDPDHRDHERGEVGDPAAVIVGGRRRRRRKHDVAPLGAVHAADSERAVLVSVVGRPRVRVARGTHGGREDGRGCLIVLVISRLGFTKLPDQRMRHSG